MSERERWVVYPLLFLALGASLRDKFSSRTSSKFIECEELRIVDPDQIGEDLQPRWVVKIARSQTSPGAPSIGTLDVDGDTRIGGQLVVQGVQVVPSLQNLVRGLQNIGQVLQMLFGGGRQPSPRGQPPADERN